GSPDPVGAGLDRDHADVEGPRPARSRSPTRTGVAAGPQSESAKLGSASGAAWLETRVAAGVYLVAGDRSVSQSMLDVMTPESLVVEGSQSAAEAARMMRDADVGSVIVLHDRAVAGIVTDRDITVRVVAEGRDPETTP